MSNQTQLMEFDREIRRYADIIDAPANVLPGLEKPGFQEGWWIEVSEGEYKLLGQDRGQAGVIFASNNQLEVLEHIFTTITFDIASEQTNHLRDFSPDGAFTARREHDKLQEELMGRLHPEWQIRQVKRNAKFWEIWNGKA